MRKRDLRELRRAAREQDFSWTQERDNEHDNDELPVDDEAEDVERLAREFRQ